MGSRLDDLFSYFKGILGIIEIEDYLRVFFQEFIMDRSPDSIDVFSVIITESYTHMLVLHERRTIVFGECA